jgi:hypothetical protein
MQKVNGIETELRIQGTKAFRTKKLNLHSNEYCDVGMMSLVRSLA